MLNGPAPGGQAQVIPTVAATTIMLTEDAMTEKPYPP
jgi:hypothetical protein